MHKIKINFAMDFQHLKCNSLSLTYAQKSKQSALNRYIWGNISAEASPYPWYIAGPASGCHNQFPNSSTRDVLNYWKYIVQLQVKLGLWVYYWFSSLSKLTKDKVDFWWWTHIYRSRRYSCEPIFWRSTNSHRSRILRSASHRTCRHTPGCEMCKNLNCKFFEVCRKV